MTKILITGFQHSGTTLLAQLINSHPEVGWIEFEEGYIEFDKPKEWIVMMAKKRVPNLKKYAWGEKIPWGNRNNDKNGKRVIEFSKKWLKFFGKDARILHILRHPIDVAASGSLNNSPGREALHLIFKSLPKYIDFINTDRRCATIVYENLLLNPELHLLKIFKFLNLRDDKEALKNVMNTTLKFGRINPERAYAYRVKSNSNLEIDYDQFTERLEYRL